jgi:hypothetical protein
MIENNIKLMLTPLKIPFVLIDCFIFKLKYVLEVSLWHKLSYFYLFFINVGVWISLRISRLISQVLKLATMKIFSGPEVCETRTGDL